MAALVIAAKYSKTIVLGALSPWQGAITDLLVLGRNSGVVLTGGSFRKGVRAPIAVPRQGVWGRAQVGVGARNDAPKLFPNYLITGCDRCSSKILLGL